MKKIISFLAIILFVYSLSAQQNENLLSGAHFKTTDVTVTWLTKEIRTNSFGLNNAGVTGAFMELNPSDLLNFNNTGKKLTNIKQVQFYLETKLKFNACRIVLMRGTDIATAAKVVSQAIDTNILTLGWNSIDLDSPYVISDSSQRLYIGYEIDLKQSETPLAAADGKNAKQGWFLSFNSYSNISVSGYVFLIKALATAEDAAANEIALLPLEFPFYKTVGDTVPIRATLKNYGTAPLTSFKFGYDVNGVQSNIQTYTGLNIAPDSFYTFTHSTPYIIDTVNTLIIKSTVSQPNGVSDVEFNNFQTNTILALPRIAIPRVVLHEVFTSSTCSPCKKGNEVLDSILGLYDSSRWACIKYQMPFPGMGDPYYTSECGDRSNFYGNVTGVPSLIADGPELFKINPANYSYNQLDALAQTPAFVQMSGTVEVNEKTVNLNVTINPISNIANENLRFFAAIVEKRTEKNRKTNGETEFLYVMKKFMTDVKGDSLTSLEINVPKVLEYNYTFQGGYRLPTNASNPINNDIENSVENFDSLMVVYWIQDIKNKVVYQSGKADPDNKSAISILKPEQVNVTVFPNPARMKFTIQSNIPFTKISLWNMSGQNMIELEIHAKEYQVDASKLTKGMYLLQIETNKGVVTRKIEML